MDSPVKDRDSGKELGRKPTYELQTVDLSYMLHPPTATSTSWLPWRPISCGTAATSRSILRGVSFKARIGEILAIAGPSGAGKSTLLEILAGKELPGRLSGEVLVNGRPMDGASYRRISGYVTQDDDALYPLLTVEETLLYSARLRLPNDGNRAGRVKALLAELGLEHVAESRVGGGNVRGISGGEKRRVSIGVDLVHNPAVLILDEPTSGLDSGSALQVMSMLKFMAGNQGKTVVVSIHQPGVRILELVSRVLLLGDGSVVHHGSMDELQVKLIKSGHCIPPHVNVLEFAMDVIQSLKIVIQAIKPIEAKEEREGGRKALETVPEEELPITVPEDGHGRLEPATFRYANSAVNEVGILSERFCKNVLRTKQLFTARTVQSTVAGLALGTIFLNGGGWREKIGFFAFTLTFLLSSTTEGLPIFLEERKILMRETSRGAYRVASYALANALVFLPFLLMVGVLYSTPVYWLVGLRRDILGFLYFLLVVWMVLLMANSFVVCFSAAVPNFIMGNSIVSGFMGCFFLFSGYFIAQNNIPKYWLFMHYMSLFKYPFEAFLINEYGTDRFRCLEKEQEICAMDGSQLLAQQGIRLSEKWSNLGVMALFIFGYRLISYFLLCYRCSGCRKVILIR
ncbi:ABC transporter G family member 10 [Nymphaea thermarum]|nr:ABC transporter G family member 10 [Nymphaea thermarum]